MARVTPAPSRSRQARPGPSRSVRRCGEIRGGAPRGERAPLGALPRPRTFRWQHLIVRRGQWLDAPVGAPPPLGCAERERIKQSSSADASRERMHFPLPLVGRGRGGGRQACRECQRQRVTSRPPSLPSPTRGEGVASGEGVYSRASFSIPLASTRASASRTRVPAIRRSAAISASGMRTNARSNRNGWGSVSSASCSSTSS